MPAPGWAARGGVGRGTLLYRYGARGWSLMEDDVKKGRKSRSGAACSDADILREVKAAFALLPVSAEDLLAGKLDFLDKVSDKPEKMSDSDGG